MPKIAATRRSCARAISNGFSRRCETGASTVVTSCSFSRANRRKSAYAARVYDRSSEGESELSTARRTGIDRIGDDAHDVPAGRQPPPVGAASGEPERVPAGEHVAQARQQTDLRSAGAPELDVEPAQRHDRGPARRRRGRVRRRARAARASCRRPRTSAPRVAPSESGRPARPNAIAQGTRISAPPSTLATTAPSAGAAPTGRDRVTASTCTTALRRGSRSARAGRIDSETAAPPSSCVLIRNRTRTACAETFLRVNVARR